LLPPCRQPLILPAAMDAAGPRFGAIAPQ